MGALEYQSSQKSVCEDADTELLIPDLANANWGHGKRTLLDQNLRAPIVLSLEVREAIVSNRQLLKKPLHLNEELFVMKFVSDFTTGYHGLMKLCTTPFPFPLVQMARTFLFFWLFTLPLSLMHGAEAPWKVMSTIFFTTYGFMGLEYVSMELDDPFGEDPSDFDDSGMAQLIYEDIYVLIYKTDGEESARSLRGLMGERMKEKAFENFQAGKGNTRPGNKI